MRRLLPITAGIILTLGLMWWFDVDLEVLKNIQRFDLILLATFGIFVIHGITAIRMKTLLSTINIAGAYKILLILEFVSKFIYAVVPGRLNIPAKALLLEKLCGTGLKRGISLTTFEYALDTTLVVVIGSLGGTLLFGGVKEIRYALLAMFIAAMAFFLLPSDIFNYFSDKFQKIQYAFLRDVLNKILATTQTIRVTWVTLLVDVRFFKVAFYTFLSWGVLVITMELLFLSMGHFVPFSWILVVTSLSFFVGGISGMPGGLGAREASMVFFYGLLGIPNDLSVIVAIIGRLIIVPTVLLGYILTLHLGLTFHKDK